MSWGGHWRSRRILEADAAAQAAEGAGAPLQLRRVTKESYRVFRGETPVSGLNYREHAEQILTGIQRHHAARERGCLCCGARFRSTGPGHRLCDDCRAARGLPGRQWEGW